MEFLDRRLQLRQPFARRFDQEQPFLSGLNLALPAINRSYSARENVDAGGETLSHNSARNPASFGSAGTSHQNQ